MGIFDFDWMDFNRDGKVDDLEWAFGFSMMEEDERLARERQKKNIWEDEPDDSDDLDGDDDSGDDDSWF